MANGGPRDRNALAHLAAARWDVRAVVDSVVETHLEATFRERRNDAAFVEMLRESSLENMMAMRAYISCNLTLDEVALERPLEFARAQAGIGIGQATLQESYRIGGRLTWERWARHLSSVASAEGATSDDATEALRWSTAAIIDYTNFVSQCVDEEYAARERLLHRSGTQKRVETVRRLLAGENPSSYEDLYAQLHYDVTASQIAVKLTGVSDVQSQQLAQRLRTASRAQGALEIRMTVSDVIIWLCRPRWEPGHIDTLVSVLSDAHVIAAVAEPAPGIKGFRSVADDVSRMDEVRQHWSTAPNVLRYRDAALEALLSSNIREAYRFVLRELGPLAADDEVAARLRETVLASFIHGSHVATAQHQNLHEHTVRNRLRRAEQLLGRSLSDRPVELQVALRLHRLVDWRLLDNQNTGG